MVRKACVSISFVTVVIAASPAIKASPELEPTIAASIIDKCRASWTQRTTATTAVRVVKKLTAGAKGESPRQYPEIHTVRVAKGDHLLLDTSVFEVSQESPSKHSKSRDLTLYNPHYGCDLKSQTSGWRLERFHSEPLGQGGNLEAQYGQRPWLLLAGEFRLPQIIVHPGFTVQSVTARSSLPSLFRLHFKFTPNPSDSKQDMALLPRRGYLDIDTDHDCFIDGYEFVTTRPRYVGDHVCRGVIVSKKDPARVAVIRETVESAGTVAGYTMRQSKLVTEFEYLDSSDYDNSVFYLSHYGLPEPQGVAAPTGSRHWWLYWLLAGATLAILAALFRWLAARRRNRLQSAAPPA